MIGLLCLISVFLVSSISYLAEKAGQDYATEKAEFNRLCVDDGKLSDFECKQQTKKAFYF